MKNKSECLLKMCVNRQGFCVLYMCKLLQRESPHSGLNSSASNLHRLKIKKRDE